MSIIHKSFASNLKAIIIFLAYSNIWVSLSVGAITASLPVINNHDLNIPIILHNICLSFLSYNYIYWLGHLMHPTKTESIRKRLMFKHRLPILLLNITAVLYVILRLRSYTTSQWIILIGLTILTLLYTLPSKFNLGLRWFPSLKIFAISLSWTVLVLPLQSINILGVEIMFKQGLLTFLFIIALTIPFDIRDMNNDSITLKTIPQLLGIQNAIRISQGLILIIGSYLLWNALTLGLILIHIIAILGCLVLISKSQNRDLLYYSFVLEGIPVYWATGLLLMTYINKGHLP